MEGVLNQGLRMIIFTDEDWVDLINEDLAKIKHPEEQGLPKSICLNSWQRWKMKARKKGIKEERYVRFFNVIKKLLSQQREGLFNKLATDKVAWQRWAWIIERKFDDWNLRMKSENLNRHEVIDKIEIEIINPNEAKAKDNPTDEPESAGNAEDSD
jgi:hypothetical protein